MELYDFFVFLLKAAFVIIVILSVSIGVIWPLFQTWSDNTDRRDTQSPVYQYQRRIYPQYHQPLDEDYLETPIDHETSADKNKKIIELAKKDNLKTTQLVRNWINEKNK